MGTNVSSEMGASTIQEREVTVNRQTQDVVS